MSHSRSIFFSKEEVRKPSGVRRILDLITLYVTRADHKEEAYDEEQQLLIILDHLIQFESHEDITELSFNTLSLIVRSVAPIKSAATPMFSESLPRIKGFDDFMLIEILNKCLVLSARVMDCLDACLLKLNLSRLSLELEFMVSRLKLEVTTNPWSMIEKTENLYMQRLSDFRTFACTDLRLSGEFYILTLRLYHFSIFIANQTEKTLSLSLSIRIQRLLNNISDRFRKHEDYFKDVINTLNEHNSELKVIYQAHFEKSVGEDAITAEKSVELNSSEDDEDDSTVAERSYEL